MNKTKALLLILFFVSLISRFTGQSSQTQPTTVTDFKKYADWSVDGVSPGMSLAEAKLACGGAELLSEIDYFGTLYSLYDGRQLDWMHSGHFVVSDEDKVISVEGYELMHLGEAQADLWASAESRVELIKDHCQHLTPRDNKHRFQDNPVVVRGEHFVTYILGEEPEWLTLCYRTDVLGDCLESQSHLQGLLAEAEMNSTRRPLSLGELSEYTGDEIKELQCPLGGDYQVNGPTLTCFSHPEGPLSITRTEKTTKFWHGAPE